MVPRIPSILEITFWPARELKYLESYDFKPKSKSCKSNHSLHHKPHYASLYPYQTIPTWWLLTVVCHQKKLPWVLLQRAAELIGQPDSPQGCNRHQNDELPSHRAMLCYAKERFSLWTQDPYFKLRIMLSHMSRFAFTHPITNVIHSLPRESRHVMLTRTWMSNSPWSYM